MTVTNVGAGCGGRGSAATCLVRVDERHCRVRRSRVVLTPEAGVKLAMMLRITPAMVATSPATRESAYKP